MRGTSQEIKFDGKKQEEAMFSLRKLALKCTEDAKNREKRPIVHVQILFDPQKINFWGKMVLNLQNRYILLDE